MLLVIVVAIAFVVFAVATVVIIIMVVVLLFIIPVYRIRFVPHTLSFFYEIPSRLWADGTCHVRLCFVFDIIFTRGS